MAERRMFAKTIIDSDAFIDMPQSTQLLYFHLSMRADDDGFINNPRSIMRNTRCNDDDLKLLALKNFIIPFESGIVVIKHWKIHNYIAKDRYKETECKEEKGLISVDEKNVYTTCIQPVYSLSTQDRIGKNRVVKESIGKNIKADAFSVFASDDVELLEALRAFEQMRTKIKAPLTDRAKSNLVAKLKRDFPKEQWIAVIDQSIDKDWKGIFPLQSQSNTNTQGNIETSNPFLRRAMERKNDT